MLKSKKMKIAVIALSAIALVGCDDENIKLPVNYDDPIYDLGTIEDPTFGNKFEDYYDSVSTASDIQQKAANQILLDISKVAHGYGDSSVTNHDVSSVVADSFEGSVADSFESNTAKAENNLLTRAQKSMVDTVKGGNYSKDNVYMEKKYAAYLAENYFYLDFADINANNNKQMVISPSLEYSDLFSDDKNYNTYMEHELYDDMRINYLTTEYIYTQSRASIGNSNARKVQIIGLKDRSDVPGAAKNLLNAYIDAYVFEKEGASKIPGIDSDPDFNLLSRLWKGITPDIASKYGDRYAAEALSAEEVQWLRDNKVLPSTSANDAVSSNTLAGKVLSDEKKLEAGKDNFYELDSSLESTYTGSYAYTIQTGVRKAFDDIVKSNLVTDGIYLSSSGISGIPSDLSSRIFSTKLTTNKNLIQQMKDNPGTKQDISLYGEDGFRYLTIADTLTGSNDEIVYYDADSKTYYLTRLLDVVDTAALSTSSSTTIYDTDAKKELISRQVAYAMSTTGSYKTNAAVYWLSRTKIDYSDEDFLEYMKTTYKDLFKNENPYTPKEEKDWIVLG